MADETHKEMLLSSWVKLDEVRGMLSAVAKGLEYEIKMEEYEMRSVINITKKLIEDILKDIDKIMV